MTDALEQLRRQAQSGQPSAGHALAQALYAAGKHEEALAALGQAARGGYLPAITELGARLATGAGAPAAWADGIGLLRFAAEARDATAARMLGILDGAGLNTPPDWPSSLSWTVRAAELGDAGARHDLQVLGQDGSEDWAALAARIDLRLCLAPAAARPLSEQPAILALPAIAPDRWCRDLIASGRDSLAQAGVTDRATGAFIHDAARTNRFAQVKLFDLTLPLLILRARMAAAAGQPTAHCEIMNLLSYEPGQAFDLHHDYLDPDAPGFAAELARDGQRVATVLVYLNADYAGGETYFPGADVRFRGEAGDGLLFRNVDGRGRVDPATLHAGLPPTRGRKWLLSQWVRDRPQRQV